MADVTLRVGNLAPALYGRLTDDTGLPLDLTDASVRFRLAHALDGTVVVDDQLAVVLVENPADLATDEANVRYDWQVGETDTPGLYYGEWQGVDGDGKPFTAPTTGYVVVSITRSP